MQQTRSLPISIRRHTPLILSLAALLGLAALAESRVTGSGLLAPARQVDATSPGVQNTAFPREIVDAAGFTVTVTQAPRRIVSTDWAIDEFLYAIVPPERVTGASDNAFLSRVSNVFALTEQFHPVVANDAERVIRSRPDLVLAASTESPDFTALMHTAGIPVVRIDTNFRSLAAIGRTIRLVGYLTGEDAAAERTLSQFRATLAEAGARLPQGTARPRVLGISGGFTYGQGTLFDDVLRSIGAVNVGAEGGLQGYDTASGELIVRWNPEWIVTGADAGQEETVRSRLLTDPSIAATAAARNGHIVVMDFRTFLPMSPLTAKLAMRLAEDIHGER